MALESITLNTGTGGSELAADALAGGEVVQYVKIIDGTADSEVPFYAGNGVHGNAMRVTIASDSTGQVALAAGSATVGEVTIGAATSAAGDLASQVDVASTTSDVGIAALAIRNDTDPATISGTDGDYEPLQLNAGALWVTHRGDIADDAALSTLKPVLSGSWAVATDGTDPTEVAEGDMAASRTDLSRRVLVTETHPRLGSANNETSAAETAELVAAQGAGLAIYITDVVMSAASAQTVKIISDSGGTPVDRVPLQYIGNGNGTVALHFRQPIRVAANTNVAYTTSAAVATGILLNYYVGA